MEHVWLICYYRDGVIGVLWSNSTVQEMNKQIIQEMNKQIIQQGIALYVDTERSDIIVCRNKWHDCIWCSMCW